MRIARKFHCAAKFTAISWLLKMNRSVVRERDKTDDRDAVLFCPFFNFVKIAPEKFTKHVDLRVAAFFS